MAERTPAASSPRRAGVAGLRRALEVGALAWAVVGAGVAAAGFPQVNADARLLVGLASIAGPLAAVAASRLLARRADRLAGLCLLVSVVTPTYFAWVLNVPALALGAALVAVPHVVFRPRR